MFGIGELELDRQAMSLKQRVDKNRKKAKKIFQLMVGCVGKEPIG